MLGGMAPRTVHRICTLCEATCGVNVHVEGGQVLRIEGDRDDPFSRGFVCPKVWGMKALHDDPDRLRRPLRRTDLGFVEIGWDEAFRLAIEGLSRVRTQHGSDAIATYLGNPSAHSLHAMVYGPVLQRALGTKQRYSASSADQLPKMLSAAAMFGGGLTIPVPDLDRTSYLLVLGANPAVSNGSLMTAPDVPRRLREVRARGGRVVVIDPRRTETAELADEHHFIRPGTDAWALLALVHVLFAEGRVRLGAAEGLVDGLASVEALAARFTPERAERATGIPAEVLRKIARELSDAPSAACYGRIGTTCQRFGTLASWAVDLVNVLTGNLDRPGGAMFTTPAANRGGSRPEARESRTTFGRWRSRSRGLPEMFGELPVSALADEVLEPGPEHVRALVTLAGNPLLSAPNASRLAEAAAALDFMVSVDFYLNETTRFAHVILPPPSPLERDTYDLALYQLAVRNVAKYSPAAVARADDHPDEWEILLTLAKGLMGMSELDLAAADSFVLDQVVAGEVGPHTRFPDLEVDEVREKLGTQPGPRRVLDLFLRTGPFGDGFGRKPDGLSLARLEAEPHGVDLGALEPRLPGVLGTPGRRIDLAPRIVLDDLARLEAGGDGELAELVLIGRRHLRSNNSWMHNLTPLVKGPERCTLLVSPGDADRLGLASGGRARVTSRVGSVQALVEISAEMMPGVVSLPHGWGHDAPLTRLEVARAHPGTNVNVLSDDLLVDAPSGNAAFNGLPVTVQAL